MSFFRLTLHRAKYTSVLLTFSVFSVVIKANVIKCPSSADGVCPGGQDRFTSKAWKLQITVPQGKTPLKKSHLESQESSLSQTFNGWTEQTVRITHKKDCNYKMSWYMDVGPGGWPSSLSPVRHGDLEEDRPQQRGGRKRGRKESDPPQKTMSCLKSKDMSLKLSFWLAYDP